MKRRIESLLRAWATAPANRPLLLRGARRVGKTYVAEEVGRRVAGDAFVKVDFQTDLELVAPLFDGPTDDVDAIMRRIAEYKRVRLDRQSAIVLFDEVQLCERALNSLRFFAGSGWRIIATGSQLGVATRRRSLPFPSGVQQETLHPLTFEEFLWALGEEEMTSAIREHVESLEPYPAHREASSLFRLYQVIGGLPAAVDAYARTGEIDEARVQQREVDQIYTADMTDPENGINALAARKLWRSIPAQLLRSSTKKFKYSEVERGGRRAKLLEPLDWLAGAGMVTVNELTECTEAPLVPFEPEEGSYFKVYLADTGLMFYKCAVNPRLWLEVEGSEEFAASSDFRGALAENSVMQAFAARDLQTYYWVPPSVWGSRGELDFVLQDDRARVVPVEVKSARNVRARTLATFMEHACSPYAIRFSERDFGRSEGDNGQEIHELPLYAAFAVGDGCVTVS